MKHAVPVAYHTKLFETTDSEKMPKCAETNTCCISSRYLSARRRYGARRRWGVPGSYWSPPRCGDIFTTWQRVQSLQELYWSMYARL